MLDDISFSERDFYQQQLQHDRRWGRAINFAIALHIAAFAGALYLPGLLEQKPLFEDVMTIDLISLPEPQQMVSTPEPATVPAKKVVAPKPPPEPEPVAAPPEPEAVPLEAVVPEPVPQPEPVVEAKPISVRPLKRKIRKAKDIRLVEEKQRQQRAAEIKRQERARKAARQKALADAQRAEKQAQDAARRARAELASVLREQQTFHSAKPVKSGSSGGARSVNSAVERQYQSNLQRRVQQLWILPEIKKWSPALETIIEFTVLRDGRLINFKIAHSSGDQFFDRFARDTVRKASPMPPFPAVIRKERMDFGIRLRPAGVQ